MRTFTIVFFTFLLQPNLVAQISEGNYVSNQEFFTITQDSINFQFEIKSAFTITHRGIGSYQIIDNFLIIYTTKYAGIKSRVLDSVPSNLELIKVHVLPIDTFPVAVGKNSKGKVVKGYTPNQLGYITITPDDNIKSVVFSSLGYDPLTTHFGKDFDYTVNLVEGETFENKNLVFAINELDQNFISLSLLEVLDKNEKEYTIKSLNKLKRKRDKNTFNTQTLLELNRR